MRSITLGLLTVCGVLAAQAPAQNQNQERRENADRAASGLHEERSWQNEVIPKPAIDSEALQIAQCQMIRRRWHVADVACHAYAVWNFLDGRPTLRNLD